METIAQFEYLKKYQCQIGQGYLFSKPISVEELEKLENFPHN
ncbi:hypothetical protein KHA80_05345 [Anaerobacillus sp. HL2]|nr:hypothetical protein KHA80_05345 [Anaerobacillus sp. HL2]